MKLENKTLNFVVINEMSSEPEYKVAVAIITDRKDFTHEDDCIAFYHSDVDNKDHEMFIDEFTTMDELCRWVGKIEKANFVYTA